MRLAYPEFLLAGWQDNVRGLCGGVSTDDVPDSLLALDAYGPDSEDKIKEIVPDWAALKPDKATQFNRAAIRHVAAKICDYLVIKLNQSERIGGEYQYQLQQIDWRQKKLDLMGEFKDYLGQVDEEAVSIMPYIDKIERSPAVYEEIEVEAG